MFRYIGFENLICNTSFESTFRRYLNNFKTNVHMILFICQCYAYQNIDVQIIKEILKYIIIIYN